jgi:hypothetical protein
MHRGPWVFVPLLLAAAIDASIGRRTTTGEIRPFVLTPDLHRLRGMWRWQGPPERNRIAKTGAAAATARSLKSRDVRERQPAGVDM